MPRRAAVLPAALSSARALSAPPKEPINYKVVENSADVTELLATWQKGDSTALDRIMPLVYDELRGIAKRQLAQEASDHTLQATALVHEAYLKLIDQRRATFHNRAHFLAIAAQVIRRLLVDHARNRNALKRNARLTFRLDDVPEPSLPTPLPAHHLIGLDTALQALEVKHPAKAKLVELRYFGGLTIEETAEVMGLSPATVKRDWLMAKAWLARAMAADAGAGASA